MKCFCLKVHDPNSLGNELFIQDLPSGLAIEVSTLWIINAPLTLLKSWEP